MSLLTHDVALIVFCLTLFPHPSVYFVQGMQYLILLQFIFLDYNIDKITEAKMPGRWSITL